MGASRTFDGTNDTIAMGDVLDFDRTDPFSLAIYYKAAGTNPAGLTIVMGKEEEGTNFRGYNLAQRGDLAGDPWGVAIVSTDPPANYIIVTFPRDNDTLWHSVVMTYSGSSAASGVSLYVDGVSKTRTTVSDTLTGTTIHAQPFRLSGRGTAPSAFNPGSYCCASVYNVALTASEAQELARGLHVYRGLVGRWYLWDNGASPTYQDYAAGNDGTATNHPAESFDGPPIQFPGVM